MATITILDIWCQEKHDEDRIPAALETLKELYLKGGHAYVVGITGSPGSGKSTLVDQMLDLLRAGSKSVGVVAVDPSSPFTGGAILGDRIRMQRHATDEGVFIRSLATRGYLGGLSRAACDIITVMDAMGKDIILVETVGVGQSEVDTVHSAHCSVVVLTPGMGDEIQAIKAGIIEIGDIYVINKSDQEGADRIEREPKSWSGIPDYTNNYQAPLESGRVQSRRALWIFGIRIRTAVHNRLRTVPLFSARCRSTGMLGEPNA